jgi:cell division septation protein DedD
VSASAQDALAALAPPPGRGYTVQVAAYANPSEALALIRNLRGKGIDAFHQSADVQGKTWHRVRVGMHGSKSAAEDSAKALQSRVPFPPYVTSQP